MLFAKFDPSTDRPEDLMQVLFKVLYVLFTTPVGLGVVVVAAIIAIGLAATAPDRKPPTV